MLDDGLPKKRDIYRTPLVSWRMSKTLKESTNDATCSCRSGKATDTICSAKCRISGYPVSISDAELRQCSLEAASRSLQNMVCTRLASVDI